MPEYYFAIKQHWRAILANDLTVYLGLEDATFAFAHIIQDTNYTIETNAPSDTYTLNARLIADIEDTILFIQSLPYFLDDNVYDCTFF